ncbi:MAG: helix-turn-helix transcriptional regulator [Butyrivibrio sp.]|nr:helix-turn-helix transcriptional regulator [Butyrivibrio sp.]MBR1640838.1 helix-turn-helix transcriptional regulator [Butyrivibrio sp.]
MQLKVSDNIKRYRKDMGLTQEELAEAMGVTIGAVSKWENGGNIPDITTLMELANLYNISMDELLGYDKSSKNIDALDKKIDDLCDQHRFEEAVSEANAALARYPHTFKILFRCARMYFYKYIEEDKEKDRESAIDLMNKSMEYLSQNTDPEITEYTIRIYIAELHREKDPEKALGELKSINYNGCNDATISKILLDTGKRDECLDVGSTGFLRCFSTIYQLVTNVSLAMASTGKKKDIEKAIEIADFGITISNCYSKEDSIGYFHKLGTILLILKAWWLSCLGDFDTMKTCTREAYELAVRYDNSEDATSDLSKSFRFYYSKNKSAAFDSLGTSAVAGIESIFSQKPDMATKKNYKHMGPVIDYWYALKDQ